MKSNNSNGKTNQKHRAYKFSLNTISFIDKLNKQDLACTTIARQLIRSSTSIGANIIEAQAGRTKRDFTNFYTHALKSANETKYWLCILRDSKKAKLNETNNLLQEAIELSKILAASILTLKGKRNV